MLREGAGSICSENKEIMVCTTQGVQWLLQWLLGRSEVESVEGKYPEIFRGSCKWALEKKCCWVDTT